LFICNVNNGLNETLIEISSLMEKIGVHIHFNADDQAPSERNEMIPNGNPGTAVI